MDVEMMDVVYQMDYAYVPLCGRDMVVTIQVVIALIYIVLMEGPVSILDNVRVQQAGGDHSVKVLPAMRFHVSMEELVNQTEYVPVNQAGREIPAKVLTHHQLQQTQQLETPI